MVVPSNAVQQQGQGAASADFLNTAVQCVANLAALRAFVGVGEMTVYLLGYASQGDNGQGVFSWQASATGPDNGTTVIVPNGVTQGAWVRDDPVASTPPPSNFVPYAAQMTLSGDTVWVGNLGPSNFFPPWDSLVTNSAPTPAFNPDSIASLTTPFPAGSPMEAAYGGPGPGFTIPVTGIYQVYAFINLECTADARTAGFETFIECGAAPWPTDGQVLNSNTSGAFSITTTGPGAFTSCNVQGSVTCNAGDVLACGIVDNSVSNAGSGLTVTALSYFGIFRVR